MLEEGSVTMEKKVPARQSPSQCRNGVTGERKSDFTQNRYGRVRRPVSNGGTKTPDVQTPRPIPLQKWDKSLGDRRQRQGGYYDYRQREEVVESDTYDVLSTGSRKGNANHLLNFKFYPRQSQLDEHRWYDKSRSSAHSRGGYRKTTRYKKEQFLQASCQFVVRDTEDYTEQAINPDVLVDWNMIELVRSFSTESVNCPICLQIPSAGKITKCGHTYCWACILHYLKLGEKDIRKCPICYDTIELGDLKSVEWIDVPDFKIGDTIEMKLMQKAKGSIFAVPKDQWEDRKGKPMNIEEGNNTKYMKLVVASCDQIQTGVIDRERIALTNQLIDAEESETCFIQMALDYLQTRELSLEQVFQQRSEKNKVYIPGLSSTEVIKARDSFQENNEIKPALTTTIYEDAFEDKLEAGGDEGENFNTDAAGVVQNREVGEAAVSVDCSVRHRNDSEDSLPFGSPPCPFPLVPDQEVNPVPLSLEETAEHLELPMDVLLLQQQSKKAYTMNTRDTYFFFQASTGQHIYLSSLNAQCLAKEYGTLEESPTTINGTVVAVERIFMTEDVRKRLRYLGHIPLTCEFHVVEVKMKPPVVSKETLKFFEAAFDKKRKLRQQKTKEEKRRAKKYEMDHRKSFGIYPERQIDIPLDNLNQFPSHLSSSMEDALPLVTPTNQEQKETEISPSPTIQEQKENENKRLRNDSTSDESLSGSMSFAQMLKAGNTSHSGGAWGRAGSSHAPPGLPDPVPIARSRAGDEEDSDGEGLPAPSYSESMSDAIAKALDGINLRRQSAADNETTPQSTSGGGRKKRKEKKILFSTAMARKS